jgi:hypothetical protein
MDVVSILETKPTLTIGGSTTIVVVETIRIQVGRISATIWP